MAEAVNPQSTAAANGADSAPSKVYVEGAAVAGGVPAQLGYGNPKGTAGVMPEAQSLPQSLGYGVPQQSLATNPEGYAQRADQSANYLASQGDIQGAMDAAQRRNTYMQENDMAYNPKPAPLAPGQTNTPGNLGYNAPTYPGAAPNQNGVPNQGTVPGQNGATTPSNASGTTSGQDTANQPPTPPQSPTQEGTTDYVNSITTKLDEFLGKSISAYEKIADDFKVYMDSANEESKKGYQAIIDNLQKKEELYQKEKEDSVKREENRRERMLDVSEQKKDNQLKQNELAKNETDAQWSQRQALAEDNNARYMGYLNGKMSAAGFVKGSAGLLSLGKYMAASELALNDITRSRANAVATYTAKGKEIMDSYFDETYQIEYDASTKISEITFKMNDSILDISNMKTQTEMTKNKEILENIKAYNAEKMAIQTQKDSLVMQVTQQKLADLQFNHQVTMDYMTQERAQETLDWQVKTDERNFGRGVVESDRAFEFQDRQQTFTETYTEKQFNQDVKEFGLTYALNKAQQDEQTRQFDKTMEYNKGKDAIAQSLEDKAYRMEMVKNGLMSPKTLDQYLNANDVILGQDYVGKDGSIENLGDKVASAFEAAGTGIKNLANGYQCVQFVRDIIPDLPTGLFTLADKVRNLTKGKGGITAPEPGATVVLNWGAGSNAENKPGHVAVVTNVSPDGKTFDIVQFNAPKAGQKSTQTIRTDDPTVMGYWKSPNIKPAQAQPAKGGIAIPGASGQLQSAIDRVLPGGTEGSRGAQLDALNRMVSSGDEKGAMKLVRDYAVQNLPSADKTDYNNLGQIVGEMDGNIKKLPTPDKMASGPYKKFWEDTKPWVALEKDPEFMSTIGNMLLATQKYKNMNFGANITPTEQAQFNSFLPEPSDTVKTLYNKAVNLRAWADRSKNRVVDMQLGMDPTTSSSQFDYVQVKDKETGETDWVERGTYDSYKDRLDLLN
jgi:hypothetical protein